MQQRCARIGFEVACIYYDAETRGTWQPVLNQLFDLDKARLIVLNRYETIYRESAFMMKQGDGKNKPSALRLMLDTTNNLVDLLGISSIAQAQLNRQHMEHVDELLEILDKLAPNIAKQNAGI
jgi:hypothetical protein